MTIPAVPHSMLHLCCSALTRPLPSQPRTQRLQPMCPSWGWCSAAYPHRDGQQHCHPASSSPRLQAVGCCLHKHSRAVPSPVHTIPPATHTMPSPLHSVPSPAASTKAMHAFTGVSDARLCRFDSSCVTCCAATVGGRYCPAQQLAAPCPSTSSVPSPPCSSRPCSSPLTLPRPTAKLCSAARARCRRGDESPCGQHTVPSAFCSSTGLPSKETPVTEPAPEAGTLHCWPLALGKHSSAAG